MNNPPIQTLFALPSPNAAPLDFTQQVILLNQLVQSEMLGGDYKPYVISQSVPSIDDRNKVWIELDTQQRPIATKIWVPTAGGAWRRVYNGMPGQICMYNGRPTDDFDENGLGLAGKWYDGWALCNGKNGTIDLSDKFIIAAHMNKAGGKGMYDGGWGTWISNSTFEKTGGNRDFTLGPQTAFTGKLTVGKYSIDAGGETLDPDGRLYGNPSAGDPDKNKDLMDFSSPTSVSLIPPFIALGFVQFVGYIT